MWCIIQESILGFDEVGFLWKAYTYVCDHSPADMCFQLIFISPPSFGNSWIFKLLGCNFGATFGLDTNHQDASCLPQGIKKTTLHIIRDLREGVGGISGIFGLEKT